MAFCTAPHLYLHLMSGLLDQDTKRQQTDSSRDVDGLHPLWPALTTPSTYMRDSIICETGQLSGTQLTANWATTPSGPVTQQQTGSSPMNLWEMKALLLFCLVISQGYRDDESLHDPRLMVTDTPNSSKTIARRTCRLENHQENQRIRVGALPDDKKKGAVGLDHDQALPGLAPTRNHDHIHSAPSCSVPRYHPS